MTCRPAALRAECASNVCVRVFCSTTLRKKHCACSLGGDCRHANKQLTILNTTSYLLFCSSRTSSVVRISLRPYLWLRDFKFLFLFPEQMNFRQSVLSLWISVSVAYSFEMQCARHPCLKIFANYCPERGAPVKRCIIKIELPQLVLPCAEVQEAKSKN